MIEDFEKNRKLSDIKNTFVSVIIPAYNVGKYIEKCVSSVMSQTYENIEIIVVNDGSTDNTKEIVERLVETDNRIKLINRINSGVSSSRNFGIDIAKGDWIIFVDGDDYLSQDYVEHMIYAANSTGAEYCISTDCFTSVREKQSTPITIQYLSPEETTALLLSHRIEVGCWNKMFSKQLLDREGIRFNTTLFYGEGLHFITQVAQVARKTSITNKRLYFYRQDNAYSATKQFNVEKIYNGWEALNVIEKGLLIKSELIQKRLNQHRCLFALSTITKIENCNAKKQYPQLYKTYMKYVRNTLGICLCDRDIPFVIKVKLILCSVTPSFLSFLSKRSQIRRAKESV